MVNEKSSAVGVNIQEKATMIWNVADVPVSYTHLDVYKRQT